MAASLINVVKNFISLENKTDEGFIECRKEILTILKNLNNSNTLDYRVEGPIIEDIYHIVYLFIKEEIKFYGISETLNNIDLVSNEFIDREVLKDMENIDLKNPKNLAIKMTKDKIDAKGFNKSYAEFDLISTIVNSNVNVEEKAEILKDLNSKLIEIEKSLDDIEKNINKCKKNSKLNFSYLIKDVGILFLNITLLVSATIGGFIGFKKFSTFKKYLTTTTIYNPLEDNPYTITEEYEKDGKNSLELLEYEPWEEAIAGNVRREITTYDLSSLEKLSYDEYLDLDLDELKIEGKTVIEAKDSLTLKDLYQNTLRLIKEVEVNKDKYVEEERKVVPVLGSILSLLLEIIIIFFIFSKRYGNYGFPIISDLKRVYDDILELLHEKRDKNIQEKEILKLEKRMLEIIKNNEEIFKRVESILPILENSPEYKDMALDVKKRLSLVRKYSQISNKK